MGRLEVLPDFVYDCQGRLQVAQEHGDFGSALVLAPVFGFCFCLCFLSFNWTTWW